MALTAEVFLLHGSSGKTDAYLQAVADVLEKGKSAIVLEPEIGLTFELARRFEERFKGCISVIHSGLTEKQKREECVRAATGERRIVIGTRMALFAPVKNLGLIVVDEEFENTYKSDMSPRYHAREVAIEMGKVYGIPVILGSATPSIESYYKAESGEYKKIELPPPPTHPQVTIVDMREEKNRRLSSILRQEIKETLARGEKVILFVNRRGFFTSAICRDCGQTIKCPHCTAPLTYHFKENILICGHCGFKSTINIVCPKCRSSSLFYVGIGTQRIEEEVGEIYKQAKIVRIDRDTTTKRGSHEKLFADFTQGTANVLIGTQMVTKGLDLAEVTLAGVVSADSMLSVPDFRSSERTFQQLVQVAGRVGRGIKPGKVIIQTINPDHYAIKCAAALDYGAFYREEIKYREELNYPPFSKLIEIIIRGKDTKKTAAIADELGKFLRRRISSGVLGPILEQHYKILLKGEDLVSMRAAVKETMEKIVIPKDIRVTVDVDPA